MKIQIGDMIDLKMQHPCQLSVCWKKSSWYKCQSHTQTFDLSILTFKVTPTDSLMLSKFTQKSAKMNSN